VRALTLFLKENLRLSSPLLMLGVFAFGVALVCSRRTLRVGRAWLILAVAGFWVLATPIGAKLISPSLERAPRVVSADQAAGAKAVVILGGGIITYAADGLTLDDLGPSAARVIEGARVYRLLGDPLVIVSGGNSEQLDPPRTEAAAFRDAIVKLGVPATRVLLEDRGVTTREEAELIKPMLMARHIDHIVLVTAVTHMTRALAAFRAVGIDAVPSASGSAMRSDSAFSFWPERRALLASDDAVYGYVSELYYRLRGWT
jgi:uncharacterized SAM-binding protein YcdF (DUF218 family)